MPPKRVKSGGPVVDKDWESALTAAEFDEESWKASVCLVVGGGVEDEMCINALNQAVQQPLRRLFTLLSWENTMDKISELGNPKTRKIKDPPMFYEVTEAVKSVLDAGEELSVDLLAKLVKFQLLTIKSSDLQRRTALQRAIEEKTKGKASSASATKDKSGAPKGSAKGEKGKKGSEPLPTKETKLKRRGEEDNSIKYIDDEPDDGPQHYILMTGFHKPELIPILDSLGVYVSSVIKLSSRLDGSHPPQASTTEEQEDAALRWSPELDMFWMQLDRMLNSRGVGSRLHDVAKLEYKVEQSLLPSDSDNALAIQALGVAVFEGVACLLYDSLDWRRQHQYYLNSLKLILVPQASRAERPEVPPKVARTQTLQTAKKKLVGEESAGDVEPLGHSVEVDMRLYSDLVDHMLVEVVSVPLILHCMLEQVVASQQEGPPGSADSEQCSDSSEHELMGCMLSSVLNLPQPEQEKRKLMEDFGMQEAGQRKKEQKHPVLLNHHNERARRMHQIPVLDGLDAVSIEAAMIEKSVIWKQLMAKQHSSSSLSMARRQELLHHCSDESLSVSEVQRLLQLCVFESIPVTTVDQTGNFILKQSDLRTPLLWDDPVTFIQQLCRTQDYTGSKVELDDPNVENKITLADLQKMLTRQLRDWNFTEHHNSSIFPQILQTASEIYRCVDTFTGSHDSVFIICHNPFSPQRTSRECWEVVLHTDVRFRNYLEHVAERVKDWIREEDQKQQREMEIDTHSQTSQTKETPSVSPVPEQIEPYIRQDSLKAWKIEQVRLEEEELSKKMKKDKDGKASAKGDRDSARESRKTLSPTKKIVEVSRTPEHTRPPTAAGITQTPRENNPVLIGYNMDGRLVQVKGETQCAYPSDGGQISVDKVQFVQGSTQLKVCVKKDGHCFYTYVTEQQRQNSVTANIPGDTERYGCFYAVLNNGIRLSYSWPPLITPRESSINPSSSESECMFSFPLSLNASLPNGLQLSFQFEDTAGSWSVCVRQQVSTSGHAASPLESTKTEFSRIITCQGTVIKHMRDGSSEVLFADGTVSSSPDSGPVCVLVPSSLQQEEESTKNTPREIKETKPKKGRPSSKLVVGGEFPEPPLKEECEDRQEGEALKVMGGSWTTTTPSGFRVASLGGKLVEVQPLQAFHATDPFSQTVVITREDHVLSVLEKDGTLVVDHEDGTRITTFYQQKEPMLQHSSGLRGSSESRREKLVRVERPGFATVTLNSKDKNCKLLFGDGTIISANELGAYTVCPSSGGVLHVGEDGVAIYHSDPCGTGPEGDQPGQYVMSHLAGVLCRSTDSYGTFYQVTADGQISVTSSTSSLQNTNTESKHEYSSSFDTHLPRLFVADSNGSALELLCAETVEEILNEAYTDPSVAVIKEPLSHTQDVFGITILKPFFGDIYSCWLLPKQQEDIIPANLKNRTWDNFPTSERKTEGPQFGARLGQGLEIKEREKCGSSPAMPALECPDSLLIRQITQNPPVTESLRAKLLEKLLGYVKQLLQREKLKDEIQLKDPRTAEEKLHHNELLQLLLSLPDSERQPITVETQPLCADAASLYTQAVTASHCTGTIQQDDEALDRIEKEKKESLWGNRINQHRLDLQEERRHRHALRNNIITSYFHPELQDMPHYVSQELDLASLSLALPPGRNSEAQTRLFQNMSLSSGL